MSQAQLPSIMPGARSVFHRRGSIGCLILHGFMASPGEVNWLGEYLAKLGHTVYVPRLHGHGVDPKLMRDVRWEEWYIQVEDAYHVLSQQCDEVYVIGHSMGGLLALLLGVAYPVNGIVAAAVPVTYPSPLMHLSRLMRLFPWYRYYPNSDRLHRIITDEQKRRGEPVLGRVHYTHWYYAALDSIRSLMDAMMQGLPQVKSPLLLLYAENDRTVVSGDHEKVAARAGSKIIETHLLTDGEHILFQDEGRDEAFEVVADFVRRLSAK